ncbi:hypothetical protein HIM_09852 [Hirsutella minnesotensis 3608]|uniref:DNA polymerase delta catalytic subunit n=1 Tax=Hirsutella minnesotensis 3608 TaxID=1043627 RepID=A0A0F7ZS54_9HYPO|nr:hypothetical protein HIM_09852 [Hirsutella minnesotensis 3608]
MDSKNDPRKRPLAESINRFNVGSSQSPLKKHRLGIFPSRQTSQTSSRANILASQGKSAFESEILEKIGRGISDLKRNNAEKDQEWDRPPVQEIDPDRDNLCFQYIEAEDGTTFGGGSSVRLFGVNEQGNSVMLHVMNFKHYLYVAAPPLFQPQDCASFKAYLESQVVQSQPTVHSVSLVMRESIYGFAGNQQSPFLKITVSDPKYVNTVRSTIERGHANWKGMWKGADGGVKTYDNIQYLLRFMVDCKIQGMSWVEAPSRTYKIVPPNSRQSRCQIEAEVSYTDLVAHEPVGEWAKMAPLRVLSL